MTSLELLGDGVVVAACIAAAAGCSVLHWRVRRLASSERGIGKAVSEMSRSVAQFEKLLGAAEESAREASTILDEQLAQARRLVARLETLKGAAPRVAVTARAPQGSGTSTDPLADVVPKTAPMAGRREQATARGATSDGTAQRRLANLAQRHTATTDAAAGIGRSART